MTYWGTFATTTIVARPPMGGQGVDVLDAEWDIDIHGGFAGATLDVVPPVGLARFSNHVNEPAEIRDQNQHKLWEGRIEEPDLDYIEADKWTMEATGYSSMLDDDGYFRRCYVDNDLASWQVDQSTKYADRFSVGIEDDDKLVLRVSCYGGDPGQVLHDGMNCRAYWQLFDGMATDQSITALKFHYVGDLLDTSLRCKLYGRDALSGGSINRLLWTSPATFAPDDDVSLDANDIGDDVTCLVFHFEQVGDVITQYTDTSGSDITDWSLFAGIAFDDLHVYASPLGSNVTPERIVRDAVLTIVGDDHIDFPDTSGYVLEHVDYSDPTTVAQAINDLNDLLDWNWGFEDGGSFFFRKPWTAANVPPGELIVTSFVDPALSDWGVRLDWSETCTKVVAHYTKPSGRVGRVTVSDYEGPLGAAVKTYFLDLTSSCNSAADATLMAQAYLTDHLWPKPTGPVTLKGNAHLAAGIDVPAIYLRPGMRIVNLDLSPWGRMLVTSVSGKLVDREITLQLGTRSNRLDRMLARREMDARKRRRRKAKR